MAEPSNGPRVPSSPEYPGAPMWVKVFVAVLVLLLVVFVLVTLFGMHAPMPGGHAR